MSRTQNLANMLAHLTRLDSTEVVLKARRLREAGMFVKETRSPSSPRPKAEDAARLMFMLMSDTPANSAKETIDRGCRLHISDGSHKHALNFPTFERPLDTLRKKKHSFLDALTALIEWAAKNPLHFGDSPSAVFNETSIEFDRLAFRATIYLRMMEPNDDPPYKPTPLADGILHYDIFGDARSDAAPRHWRNSVTIDAPFLGEIGKFLACEEI